MPKREVQDFISHWSAASASERANSQPFLLDLRDLLDVPPPRPAAGQRIFFRVSSRGTLSRWDSIATPDLPRKTITKIHKSIDK
jgi:hypothetical protein